MRSTKRQGGRVHLDEAWQLAAQLAQAGGEMAGRRFQQKRTKAVIKSDSSYTTQTDVRVERMLKHAITRQYPAHRIWGEETGLTSNSTDYCWNIDPIDGTHNFMFGVPVFGTLINLSKEDEVVLSAAYDPNTHTLFTARKNHGAFVNGKRFRVKQRTPVNLREKTLHVDAGKGEQARDMLIDYLSKYSHTYRSFRKFGCILPPYHAAVTQQLGAVVMFNMETWEIGTLALFLREAGLAVTNFAGDPWNLANGSTMIATHEQVLAQVIATVRDSK